MQTPTPQSKTKPPILTGNLEFNCCGIRQSRNVESNGIVKCEHCGEAYTIWLHKIQVSVYQGGWKAYDLCTVESPVVITAFETEFTLSPGQEYQIANDCHNLLGLDSSELPVLVQHPKSPELVLILRVPKLQLRKVPYGKQSSSTTSERL